jgi:vesicle-fusing ATPase
MNDFI